MVSRLNPYIGFGENARAALEFYREVFGGTLTLETFADFGDKDAPGADLVMHGMLVTPDGYTLMAADTAPGETYLPGSNISIGIDGDDADMLRGFWEKLTGDGVITVPLDKQMWGDEFGMCQDKFGVTWMVNINAGPG